MCCNMQQDEHTKQNRGTRTFGNSTKTQEDVLVFRTSRGPKIHLGCHQ